MNADRPTRYKLNLPPSVNTKTFSRRFDEYYRMEPRDLSTSLKEEALSMHKKRRSIESEERKLFEMYEAVTDDMFELDSLLDDAVLVTVREKDIDYLRRAGLIDDYSPAPEYDQAELLGYGENHKD